MFFKKKEISNVRKKAEEDGINEEENQKEEAEESAKEGSRNACVEFALSNKVGEMVKDGKRRKKRSGRSGRTARETEEGRRSDSKRRTEERREGMYSRTPMRVGKRKSQATGAHRTRGLMLLHVSPFSSTGAKGLYNVPLTFHGPAYRSLRASSKAMYKSSERSRETSISGEPCAEKGKKRRKAWDILLISRSWCFSLSHNDLFSR